MGFVARLPTFHNEVQVHVYDPVSGLYLDPIPLTGQIYTPQRGQDDEAAGLLYLMYPKAMDILHDPYDYNTADIADVIEIEFPTGSGLTRLYAVREVCPRWLGFANEHLIASLKRMSATEAVAIPLFNVTINTYLITETVNDFVEGPTFKAGISHPGELRDDLTPIVFFAKYGKENNVLRDGEEIDETVSAGVPNRRDVISFIWPSGSGLVRYYDVGNVNPVNLGKPNEYIVASLRRKAQSEVSSMSFEDPPPPPPGSLELVLSGVSNDICWDCTALNGTFPLTQLSSNHWQSGPTAGMCSTDGFMLDLTPSGSTWAVTITYANPSEGGTVAVFTFDGPWDFTTTETFALFTGLPVCDWSAATMTVGP